MRRDMEYVRLMLIDLSNGKFNRKIPRTDKMPQSHEKEEYEKYMYHLTLLRDGGFISYKMDVTFDANHLYDCPRLTWDGNDFLDAIENDTVWNKTKGVAKEKGLEIAKISFDVVKNLAIQQSKKMLGIE